MSTKLSLKLGEHLFVVDARIFEFKLIWLIGT